MQRDEKNGEGSQCFEFLMRSGVRGSAHDTEHIASLRVGSVCSWDDGCVLGELNVGVFAWEFDLWTF